MTETEVEISTECEDSLKEALLDLCSGIPDELPDHPGLDERSGITSAKSWTVIKSAERNKILETALVAVFAARIFNFLNSLPD